MANRGRHPTIIDVAEAAAVSMKTVSRVLNRHPRVAEVLRTRVLTAMSELDYRPNLAARSLGGGRSYSIALLVERTAFSPGNATNTFFDPYLADLQAGALLACGEAGYQFFVEPYGVDTEGYPDIAARLAKISPDGVMLAPPSSDQVRLLAALEERGIPYVRIAPGTDLGRAPSVATDEYEGTVALAEHLLALGHRRIAMICGPASHIAASVRLVAFKDALRDRAELTLCKGDFTFSSGLAAGERLLASPNRPSAIFAANDFMAAGVIGAAAGLGLKVPLDVSVAGFDDCAIAGFVWPPLTTVRQPVRAMARMATNYLVSLVEGREVEELWAEMPLELVIRASTGPAPVSPKAEGIFADMLVDMGHQRC